MTIRLLTVVIMTAAIGAGLLGLRQQQNNDRHTIAAIHASMRKDREAIKDIQIRIAEQTQPETLRRAIERAGLRLEPIGVAPAPALGNGTNNTSASAGPLTGGNTGAHP